MSWAQLATARPDLADAGRELLYQHGVGLAFMATVRKDGGPRVHPMCPLLVSGRLFAFITPSPKQRDLLRDPRFSMHSFPCPANEDACYLTGTAALCVDGTMRDAVAAQFVRERSANSPPAPVAQDLLFEFSVETALITRTGGHGESAPKPLNLARDLRRPSRSQGFASAWWIEV